MIEKCILCSSEDTEAFSLGKTKLLHCKFCDITYNQQIPDNSELEKYYSNTYVLEKNELKPIQRFMHRLPESVSLISKISKYKPSPQSILDIGCDKGFFIDFARHFGYKACGVELSASARAYCEKLDLKVYDNLEKVDEKFDIVVMWHSFEHFNEPKQALENIKKRMKDDARLFIRVPNFSTVWRKIFRSRWVWFQPDNHYYHYSPRSLRFILENSGFALEELSTGNPNNMTTLMSNCISNRSVSSNFNIKLSIKQNVLSIYELIAASEIFAICRIK